MSLNLMDSAQAENYQYIFHFYMDLSYSIQTNNANSVCGKGKF